MITGTGVDIIELERMRNMENRYGLRFLRKVFTDLEISYCQSKLKSWQHFAGRFAVKEAVLKGMDLTVDQGMRLEADLNIILQTTQDRTEGIRSFLDRRPPHFTGR